MIQDFRSIIERARRATGTLLMVLTLAAAGTGIYTTTEVRNNEEQIRIEETDNRREQDHINPVAADVAVLKYALDDEPHIHGVPCVCSGTVGQTRREFELRLGFDCDARAIADAKSFLPPGFSCQPAK